MVSGHRWSKRCKSLTLSCLFCLCAEFPLVTSELFQFLDNVIIRISHAASSKQYLDFLCHRRGCLFVQVVVFFFFFLKVFSCSCELHTSSLIFLIVLCGEDADCALSPSWLGPQLYGLGAALKARPGACPGSHCALLPTPIPGRFLRYNTDTAMAWAETTGQGRNEMAAPTLRKLCGTGYCPAPLLPLKTFYLWESKLKGGDLHAQNRALTAPR